MTRKIRPFSQFSSREFNSSLIVVCSEESVRCKYLPRFIQATKRNSPVLVAMPETDLVEGSRGRAKAQILISIRGIKAVVACSNRDLKRLMAGEFKKVVQMGRIVSRNRQILFSGKRFDQRMKVKLTSHPDDQKFIKKAQSLIVESDCWWRPTACIFVRGKKVLMTSACFSHWQTNCKELSIRPTDISLAPGEKISFCDGIHSEKIGIARAARKGISLDGATLYATGCPCEECAKEIIEAGIKRVVFDKEYYDREGLILLKKHGIEIARIRNAKP